MGFVKEVFGKEAKEVTIRDVRNLINFKKAEDRFLEYKSPAILANPEQLSQWVSAFLNAEGGLIIVGLCEDDVTKKESLNANIYLIQESAKSTKAVYLVEIPQGDNPPYQASDGRYYRRLNATKYAMNHYEISDLFGKRKKPLLTVFTEITDVKVREGVHRFSLRFFAVNSGRTLARYAQFAATFTNAQIEKIDSGDVIRIDDIRDGKPSIQWDYTGRVLHPTGLKTLIAVLTLALENVEEPVAIEYVLAAEDMEPIKERYTFSVDLLDQAKKMLREGKAPVLSHD